MFLLFLCLGTILAPSCQLSSSPPLVWVCHGGFIPPLQPLYDGSYAVCATAPAHSPFELGHRMRSSPSAPLRTAQQRTLRLAARVTAADRWARAQAVLPQLSRSRLQTRWFLCLPPRCRHKMVPELFSYPARRFLHARDWRRLHSLHRCGTRPVNEYRLRG
jgi:hypothetical protein